MHDGQGGFPLIPTFLAEESFLDVFPYNAGNQLRTLEGDVVDAVFQPDNLAPWHGPGGSGDAGFPSLQPFHCCGVAALPGGQEQHRTLHPGVQLGRVVIPQGFDDSYVVLAAELRTDCIVLKYGKVGENSFLHPGCHHAGLVAVADPLQKLVHCHAGEHGRGHLHPGFLQGRVAGRRFDHAAINEAQPAGCRRVSHGEFQGHVAAPGVPDYYGPVQSHSPDEPQQVMGYRTPAEVFDQATDVGEERAVQAKKFPTDQTLVSLAGAAGLSLNSTPVLPN